MSENRDPTDDLSPAALRLSELDPAAYDLIRRLASSLARRFGPKLTLRRTDIAHDALIRLMEAKRLQIRDRDHLIRITVATMKLVVLDHLRSRFSQKRDGVKVELSKADPLAPDAFIDELFYIAELSDRLALINPKAALAYDMVMFAGLTPTETARKLDISDGAVRHRLRYVAAWLKAQGWTGTRESDS